MKTLDPLIGTGLVFGGQVEAAILPNLYVVRNGSRLEPQMQVERLTYTLGEYGLFVHPVYGVYCAHCIYIWEWDERVYYGEDLIKDQRRG